jgi:anti-anti-sigma regulatory factor
LAQGNFPVRLEDDRVTLTVRTRRLTAGNLGEFRRACGELLESQRPLLVVDLCSVAESNSAHLGALVHVAALAQLADRRLRVTASGHLAGMLGRLDAGLLELRVTGGATAPAKG